MRRGRASAMPPQSGSPIRFAPRESFADCTNRSCRMHGRVRGHRPPAVLCSHRTVASLRGRLRLLTVSLTVAFGAAALLAVSHLRVLETSVTEILSRNYRSIEAAEGMARVLADLRLAVRDGRCPDACGDLWTTFEQWLAVEHGNYTEPGEVELARRIDTEARALFAAATAGASVERLDRDAGDLDRDLHALVALNKNAMFAADRGTRTLANRLVLGVLATLALLALVVAGTGWKLASAVARPLTELAARLRSIGPRGPYPTLGPQPLAELEQVAHEYRKMAERLEGFEQLNVEAVLDEKAKTEAVIESIDDGLVVLDPAGSVLHMNEVARAILGLEQIDVPGVPFDRLGSDHPHYLRLREAVRQLLAQPDREPERVELALFLRGRDHYYVLRPTPLRARDGSRAGLILALQDVTYLRDQEARFEQLVATLSHELGSPLTSLRMAVELLGRDDALAPAPRALVDAAQEDVARLQDLAQRLLDLSRARATSIPLERRNVDLREVIPRTVKLFALQAREKGIALESAVADAGLTIAGDPTKLTWALSNLLANALRYTPPGRSVRVEAAAADGSVVVSVSDTGGGIAPDQQERIFDRFVQSGEGGNIGAAGLGLAIVRDIVHAHGGGIPPAT